MKNTAGVWLPLVFAALLLAACAGSATRESTGEYIDNSLITARVKTELLRDPVTKGMQIQVESFKGVVQLSGFVETAEEKRRAGEIAKAQSGVKAVRNDLVVKTAR